MRLERNGWTVTDDPAAVDVDVVHRWLSEEAYWAIGVPREQVERSIAHSLCLTALAPDGAPGGFCRVVTDYATFGWLCDVFVAPEHRGAGAGGLLVEAVAGHPDLQGLRSIYLSTADAAGLYERHGWHRHEQPDRVMVRRRGGT